MTNGQGSVPPGYPPQAAPTQPQPAPVAPQPAAQPAIPAPVAGATGLPQYHLPDDTAVMDAYQQHRQEAAGWGTGGPKFVKWAGPTGQTRWDASVPAGFDSSVYAYILPPWAAGKGIFKTVKSHFWKSMSNPSGRSIGCPGKDTCLICQAKEAAMHSPDPQVAERAKNFGRVRTQYLYNVVLLDNPNGHIGEDGLMRPFILGAGHFMHKAIGDIIEDKKGAINIVDPVRGRPIRLKKRKTGREIMEVEYAAIAQDPAALDPWFYPALQNVWDLDKQDRQPTMEDMMQAVQDMGLPLPHAPAPVATPGPAYTNPYPPQAAPVAPVGQPAGPTFMPPPADPYATTAAPPPAVAPQTPQVAPPAAPPAMAAPPPVTSVPAAQEAPVAYQPQAGQVPAPPPPGTPPATATAPVTPGAIPPAPPVTAPPQVQAQVAAPTPGVRPPCFGKHNPQDRTCQACPDQLKGECVVSMGQAGQDLQQLQTQLGGQ